MKRSTLWIGCAAQLLLTLASAHAQTGSPAKGQMIFESRCVACHSLDANRVGPALGTVVGRVAGKARGPAGRGGLSGITASQDHFQVTEVNQVTNQLFYNPRRT